MESMQLSSFIFQNQVNISDNISRYLQSELKLLTTHCAQIEATNLGPKVFGAVQILKQYAIHKCGHENKPISAANCLLSMVNKNNNENHYIIATQDMDLQKKLRATPAVPLMYLHNKAPVLEKPSPLTEEVARKKFSALTDWEKTAVEAMRKENGIAEDDQARKPRKKKKKGANPLSCKKKKKTPGSVQGVVKKDSASGEVKKRKKVRIPKHVKEELLKLNKTST